MQARQDGADGLLSPCGRVLVDFAARAEVEAWSAIDDVVMGGRSSSELRVSGTGSAFFAGTVALEHGGGFASIRSPDAPRALDGRRGLRLHCRGDGQRYKLRVRTSTAFDGIVYQAPFPAPAGVWSTAELPFESFVPVFRGRSVPGMPPLGADAIVSFGLLISDGQAGSFRLELAWITAF